MDDEPNNSPPPPLNGLSLSPKFSMTGKGFYGEINVLIFLKKLNGNYELVLSPSELYEFYLYLDSLESSLGGNYELIQQIFDKVYSESDLFMTNVISIGNHMSLNLSSEYGVTLFEALSCTMNYLCKKLQSLQDQEKAEKKMEDDMESNQDQDNDESDDESEYDETGSVIIHDINEEKQIIINCALIVWDIIKLLLKYNIKIYHRESNYERISYYTITILYQSFLILFDGEPYKGDIIDRYIALILKSVNCHAMSLDNDTSLMRRQSKHKNGYNTMHRNSIDHSHPNNLLDIDYFMPSILTITGDPGIVLCHFWFGGAFPTKSDEIDIDINTNIDLFDDNNNFSKIDHECKYDYHKYDGCPSPEMVMNLWFRGFNIIDFCWSPEDIITEYDYCDMIRNEIYNNNDIWSLRIIYQYGHNIVVYLWIFKMMYNIIQNRFINLMKVYLNEWDENILIILSQYHLGLELNCNGSKSGKIWNDEELTYYAMLHIFDIRSDWKSWIATKILPELSEINLNLIKKITSNIEYPEISEKWNNKFISQIYNINNSHFMQYVFIYGGSFNISSMRLLIAINSYNYNYINYLISFTNFNHPTNFWSLWNNTSLFLGLLNNKNVDNDVIELILYKMQRKYDGINSEYIINNCCIKQFCQIMTFNDNDIIWKRLLWILLKTSKYAKKDPFKALNIHKYGIPIICKNLDIKKLKYFINANLLNPKVLFTDYYVRQLCKKDEDNTNPKEYTKIMKFLVVLFDWICDKCKNEAQIQSQLKQYLKIAKKYRD